MGSALAASTFTVARAGAMSLAEIFAMGLPSILVPYPYAAANHQWHNAQSAVKAGASQMIEDKELTPERLMQVLEDFLACPEALQKASAAAQNLGHAQATQKILDLVLKS